MIWVNKRHDDPMSLRPKQLKHVTGQRCNDPQKVRFLLIFCLESVHIAICCNVWPTGLQAVTDTQLGPRHFMFSFHVTHNNMFCLHVTHNKYTTLKCCIMSRHKYTMLQYYSDLIHRTCAMLFSEDSDEIYGDLPPSLAWKSLGLIFLERMKRPD